jgi:hypothetical protein
MAARAPGHTHANAAALRTGASDFVRNYASYMGSSVFSIGMSKSDQRKNIRGSRQWYWAKDVQAVNSLDTPRVTDTLYMCDVDYYVDIPNLLTEHFSPVVLYTVVPESACSTAEDDTSFCFDADGNLHTTINGGGSYKHPLWDYGSDSLLTQSYWFFGLLPWTTTSYAVERKQVGIHRQVVLLTPIRRFYGLGAFLANLLLETKPLKRFQPIVVANDGTRFVRFKVQKMSGLYVTLARPGSYVCATVPASADDAVATISRLGKTSLMLPSAASWIKDDRAAAAVLTEYHRVSSPCDSPYVFPIEQAVRSY